MLQLLRADCDANVAELRKWLIQIFNYETATDPGHTITEWIDKQGGWVRVYMFKKCNYFHSQKNNQKLLF